jgi:hypothetical protein
LNVLQWKMLVMFRPLGLFYCHLVYFMTIWYILWSFGYVFPALVCFANKNLATLEATVTILQD